MKLANAVCMFVAILFLTSFCYAQGKKSTPPDSVKSGEADSTHTVLKKARPLFPATANPMLPKPTMPGLRISEQQKKMQFRVAPQQRYLMEPGEVDNYDAMNKPFSRGEYELPSTYIPPLVPITPINPNRENPFTLLPFNQYSIPTRHELDILEVLWAKDNVTDTTIYSTLDTTANMTMADLQHILTAMTKKGFLGRKMVSPRFEFNAFGVMIEMSMQNRRNRVFEYRTKVDETTMKRFIDANAYLYKDDKSIVNYDRLRAARHDSTLLNDLNAKIKQPPSE